MNGTLEYFEFHIALAGLALDEINVVADVGTLWASALGDRKWNAKCYPRHCDGT